MWQHQFSKADEATNKILEVLGIAPLIGIPELYFKSD